MWTLSINSSEIIEVLSTRIGCKVSGATRDDKWPMFEPIAPQAHFIWAEEPTGPNSLPNLIVTANGQAKEFLAWTSTYLDWYRPLTAHCRVVEWDDFKRVSNISIPHRISKLENALAALTLAEALTHGYGRINVTTINVPTCESTYSFCLAQAIVLGIIDQDNYIASRWKHSRELAKQPTRTPSTKDIAEIWGIVNSLALDNSNYSLFPVSDNELAVACQELMDSGSIDIATLNVLTNRQFDIDRILKSMTESRENRIELFEKLFSHIESLRLLNVRNMQFFLGYIASLLNQGTLDYIDFVSTYIEKCPTILLWYSLCEGLQPQSKILGQFGGLCRRILRDIKHSENLLSSPQCDISIDELAVLSTSRGGFDYLRIGSQSPARVEIFPIITTSLRLSPNFQSEQASLSASSKDAEVENWIHQLGLAIEGLNSTYNTLAKSSNPDKYYNSPRPRRGRK